MPSEDPVFRLAGMELLKIDTPVYHISRYLPAVRQSTAPFSFVMCLTLPYARRLLALVIIFEADGMLGAAPPSDDDDEDDGEKLCPFDLCMARSATPTLHSLMAFSPPRPASRPLRGRAAHPPTTVQHNRSSAVLTPVTDTPRLAICRHRPDHGGHACRAGCAVRVVQARTHHAHSRCAQRRVHALRAGSSRTRARCGMRS